MGIQEQVSGRKASIYNKGKSLVNHCESRNNSKFENNILDKE